MFILHLRGQHSYVHSNDNFNIKFSKIQVSNSIVKMSKRDKIETENLKRYTVIREIRNSWKRIVKITPKQTKKISEG